MMRANFFWHGELSVYEKACLSSYVKHGITPRLHAFNMSMAVPPGVELFDARGLAAEEEVFARNYGYHKRSIAAFADIYRYRLLRSEPGWYFDMDMFCLRTADAYEKLEATSRGLIVGAERPNYLTNSVMFVSDAAIAQELVTRAESKGLELTWGDIGPTLINELYRDKPSSVTVLEPQVFHGIYYKQMSDLFDPARLDWCLAATRDSTGIHIWNEYIRRWHVPKNVPPCKDSFLHKLFTDSGVECDYDTALPFATFVALASYGQIGKWDRKALAIVDFIRRSRARLQGLRR